MNKQGVDVRKIGQIVTTSKVSAVTGKKLKPAIMRIAVPGSPGVKLLINQGDHAKVNDWEPLYQKARDVVKGLVKTPTPRKVKPVVTPEDSQK